MRMTAAGVLLLLTIPAVAGAQTSPSSSSREGRISLYASAGPTLMDAGNSLSAGVGFTPTPRLTVTVSVQRDHLNHRSDEFFSFRGGTVTTVAGEARFNVAPGQRVSPYLFGGMGKGISRPNVVGPFESRLTNSAGTIFAGAGLQIPIDHRFSVVADARFVLVAERDDIGGMWPVRLGLSYRF